MEQIAQRIWRRVCVDISDQWINMQCMCMQLWKRAPALKKKKKKNVCTTGNKTWPLTFIRDFTREFNRDAFHTAASVYQGRFEGKISEESTPGFHPQDLSCCKISWVHPGEICLAWKRYKTTGRSMFKIYSVQNEWKSRKLLLKCRPVHYLYMYVALHPAFARKHLSIEHIMIIMVQPRKR